MADYYEHVAIPDQEVPQASDPLFHHLVATYASETNKTASMWRAIPDDLLNFKPHEKVNTIRAILVHQILSERRFFAQFVGTEEQPVEELLPPADQPPVQAYLDKYVGLAYVWGGGPLRGPDPCGDLACFPRLFGRPPRSFLKTVVTTSA